MYKIIRLVTGDVIFGNVTKKFSDMSLQVLDPKQIILAESGAVYLVPYNPFSGDEFEIFSYCAIVSESTASASMITIYEDSLKIKSPKDSSALN